MLSGNLEFNQLQREVLLGKPKIINEHKSQSWGAHDYIFVGKEGANTDVIPTPIDVSSANELKIIVKSQLDKPVILDEMRVYHPYTSEMLHAVKLRDYYPVEMITIQPNTTFVFGKKEIEGLSDVNIFDDLLPRIIFIIRSVTVVQKPTAGKKFDFTIMGRV